MGIQVGSRTISATGGSIKRVGNYRVHTFPSELVTDGLVLNLDAGDPRSYPGSGTAWTDLSGRGNNGTFGASTAAPTYSNANGGSLVFDGSNDYVSLGTPSIGTGKITVNAWIKITTGGIYQHIVDNQSSEWHLAILNDNSPYFFNGIVNHASTPQLSTGVWYMLTGVQGITNDLYINGVLAQNGSLNSDVNITTNTLQIGRWYSGPSRYFNGNIAQVSIYNRALSAAEVAQNYDALKVRYTGYTNTFTPLCGGGSGKVEVLCVAGGGGGGASIAGGGGGGGLLYNSAFTVNASAGIALTVGAVGAGGTDQFIGNGTVANNTNGGNSSFSSLISIGGGKGGPEYRGDGFSGGSGGGASRSTTPGGPIYVGGASTVGQGNSGGTGSNSGGGDGYGSGAGGGGAGSVGGNAIGSTAGNGGNGLVISISGASITYSGGGGGGAFNGTGGTGGSGGGGSGGSGASNSVPQNALPNTGSGGGGGGYPYNRNAGNGSNGIIIVRYPATDYNVELLIVGGGGGGGFSVGSGGGAGGLLYYSSYSVSAGTKYTITVGSGSTAMTLGSTGVAASNGNNSIFGPLVAYGGGGGTGQSVAYPNGPGGKSGGSGSGGTRNQNTPGQGVAGQGNAGGRGSDTASSYGGGGGGGAGAVGGDGSGTGGGAGGNGLAFGISGISSYYAGGGGGASNSSPGGAGGLGGGGAGTAGLNGTSAVANTGGGGGAGDAAAGGTIGGNGGSGIIIIAYQGPQRGLGGTVDTTSRPGYTLHKFTTTGTDFFIP